MKVPVLKNPSPMTLQIISLILTFTTWRIVSGEHSHICFRPPPQDPAWPHLKGLGVDHFPSSEDFWGLWHGTHEDHQIVHLLTAKLKIHLTVYAVFADQTHLNGWFRVKLSYSEDNFPDNNIRDGIKMFVLWIENQLEEVIGEWVTDMEFPPKFPNVFNCPVNDLTRYMAISCGGAYPTQPIVSNVALFVRNESTVLKNKFPDKHFVGPAVPYGDKKEFNFYMRISSHSCSWIRKMFIKGRVAADRHPTLYPLLWSVRGLGYSVIGAPDLVPTNPNVVIDCSKEILEGKAATVNPNLPFYFRSVDDSQNTSISTDPVISRALGCQSDLFGGRCLYHKENIHKFVGVTADSANLSKHQNEPEPYNLPTCLPPWEMGNLGDAYTYTKLVVNSKLKQPYLNHVYETYVKSILPADKCSVDENTCISRPMIRNLNANNETQENKNIQNTLTFSTDPQNVTFDDLKGLHITKEFVVLWNLRKGHGCANVIVTFFLVPVSIFLSRHFKETFMEQRILFSRLWYQVHIHSTGWIAVLMISGGIVAQACQQCFGPSLTFAGLLHRSLGYGAYLTFVLAVLGGGARSIDAGTRKCMIGCHWMWGMLFYLLCIACTITSVLVPGSPIADTYQDGSEYPNYIIWSHNSVVVMCGWWALEILLNFIMNCMRKVDDSNMEVERPRVYCPAPIPVIREEDTVDAEGSCFRKFMLVLYVSTAVFFTLFLCGLIRFNNHEGKGFGPLYCTHDDNGVPLLPNVRTECTIGID